MLVTIEQTINGASSVMRISGRYFRLLETVSAVDVEFGRALKMFERLQAVEAGAWYRIPAGAEDFDSIRITTSGSEAVKFVVSDGEAGYDRLFISEISQLPGRIADNADAQAAVGAAGILAVLARLEAYNGATFDRLRVDNVGGVGALRVTNRGYAYGASFQSTSALAANTPEQIFSPASNVNGAILWRSTHVSNSGGAALAVILAKASAPSGVADGDVISGAETYILQVGGSYQLTSGKLEQPVFIPAGKGLYRISAVVESQGYSAQLYTLL